MMKTLAGAVVLFVLVAASVAAQGLSRTYTEPAVPPREVLDRLNLKMAWRVYLPMEKRRERIFSVHLLDDQMLIQTLAGAVFALDPFTGAMQWRAQFGVPYAVSQPLGFNADTVFAVNGTDLFVLNRKTGLMENDFDLPYSPAAAPVADESQIYLSLGTGRIHAFALPRAIAAAAIARGEKPPSEQPDRRSTLGVAGRALQAVGPLSSGLQAGVQSSGKPHLTKVWEYQVGSRLEQTPLVTPEFLLLAGSNGSLAALSKFSRRELYHFQGDAPVSAPLGQHGELAYMAQQDFNVYALDIVTGRMLWRFLGAGPILRKPAVTDSDVYIAPERAGLARLDRSTGFATWQNSTAEAFLASNPKFVYATDTSGRLLVLDRSRGIQLAIYEGTRDFVFPIPNELTDRIYLASNDGLIVCLHDRDYPAPLRMKTVAAPKAAPEGKAAAAGDMGAAAPAPEK